jgi:caffeoyl-CoA O-methyltransferase
MLENEEALNAYLESTCDEESELLRRVNRETYLRETMPHMLSGHFQGRVLAMLSKLVKPARILEIGTFTGYATLCLKTE